MDVFNYISSQDLNEFKLVFVTFKDEAGYTTLESRHSIMLRAKSYPELIEAIKQEINLHYKDGFKGKIIVREFKDTTLISRCNFYCHCLYFQTSPS